MTDLDTHTKEGSLLDVVNVPGGAAEEANPWSSSTDLRHIRPDVDEGAVAERVAALDSEAAAGSIEPVTVESLAAQEEVSEKPAADASVLNEFDPLAADPVEQNARDAWAMAESHPPPLPVKESSVVDPTNANAPPQEDISSPLPDVPSDQRASPAPQPAPPTSSKIPSLASLARTLTLSPRRSSTPPLPPPPRSSSLRHSHHASTSSIPSSPASPGYAALPRVSEKVVSDNDASREDSASSSDATTTTEGVTITTSPKPDGQFDFQKFLDQMKTKGADPIAKYLRSFLSNFAKKTFTVNDQIKIIHDFLDFIADKMRTMDGSPWQNAPAQEFDNAMEAMEKLVMNRLYEFTFQPLLPPPLRTTDDLERDHVLRQRISLFEWLREEHLDVPTGSETGQGGKEVKGFLEFAQQELLKINHYKAPRDKLICILNCCKVIFGLIRHVRMAEGADSFIPILIFVVLKANPEHLLSNIEYINRFRSPSKLQSEAGYYLSSLMGAVSFIETMDHSSLSNISQEEFEQNVETAIQSLPVTRTPSPTVTAPSTPLPPRTPRTPNTPTTPSLFARPSPSPLAGEEAARPLSLPMPSSPDVGTDPNPSLSQVADDTRRFFQRTSDNIISKPLAAIGRIFTDVLDGPDAAPGSTSGDGAGPHSEDGQGGRRMGWRDLPGPFAPLSVGSGQQQHSDGQAPQVPHWSHPDQIRQQQQQGPNTPLGDGSYRPPIQTPYKPRIRPAYSNSSSPAQSYSGSPSGTPGPPLTNQPLAMGPSQAYRQSPARAPRPEHLQAGTGSPHPSRNPTPTLDFGAMQDEIDRAHLAAQDAARATLMQIFPTVDREVAEMVLEANDGDLGKSIEGLLEISGQSAGVTA